MLLLAQGGLPGAFLNASSYLDRYGNANSADAVTALLGNLNDNITTIYFPAGTYVIPGGVFIIKRSNVSIVGSGMGATVIKMADNNSADQGAVIQVADYSDTDIRGTIERVSIRDLTVDGNKANQLQGSASENGINTGIVVEDAKYVLLQNVETKDCDGYGIGVVGSDLAHRESLWIHNCVTHGNIYDGMDIKSGFERVIIDGLETYDNGTGGSPISGRDSVGLDLRGKYLSISNVNAYDGSDMGIRVRVNVESWVELVNCNAYNNTLDGFSFDAPDTAYVSVTNCHGVANTRHGGNLTNGHYNIVNSNFDGNGSMGLLVGSNVEHVGLIGSSFANNTLDGVNIDSSTLIVNATGCLFKDNDRRGCDIGKGGLRANGCTFDGNVEGVLFDTTTVDSILNGCSFRNNSAESIQYTGTNSGNYHYIGCVFADTTDESGTLPTNRVVKHCIGLADT